MTKQSPLNYDPFKFIEMRYLNQRKAHTQGGAAFDNALVRSMTRLSNAYRAGKNPELTGHIDQLAYVIQYAPIGMAAVQRHVLELRSKVLPPQFSILSDEPLRIVSIGAGPGTDLFGFLTALAAVPLSGISFT